MSCAFHFKLFNRRIRGHRRHKIMLMKKLNFSRVIIALAVILIGTLPSFADDFEVNGIYYYITSSTNKTVEVTYSGNSYNEVSNEYTGVVTIPSSVSYFGTTYSVTSIGHYAFYDCTGLTSVTIPNSVTSIGDHAFRNCSGLTSVTIPNSVTSIGDYAFPNCTGLTEVTIPNSVTSIGMSAFENCSGLTSVTITNSVTSIGTCAFYNCVRLTSVTIPNSVTTIGSSAFSYCDGLTEVNYNAENCTTMGSSSYPVFRGCKSLKTINIGNSVKTIPSYAFSGCDGLTSVTIPNSVTSIGAGAFRGSGLRLIFSYCMTPPACEDGAFYGCYAARLMVPEGTYYDYLVANEWYKFDKIQEIAGVEGVEADNNVVEIARYDIYGRQLTEPTKGINIIKMSDGSTCKEYVK